MQYYCTVLVSMKIEMKKILLYRIVYMKVKNIYLSMKIKRRPVPLEKLFTLCYVVCYAIALRP